MERSDPDDGWNDGNDASSYPAAPVPAHERQWRHPSEVGQQVWQLTEPSVVLGRGLLVTTGTIGCALGLAILWMLLPVGGSGSTPTAEPVATRSVASLPGPRPGAATVLAPASASAPASTISRENDQSTLLTLPAEVPPSNTMLLPPSETGGPRSIAVMIGDSPMMVTTANALGDRHDPGSGPADEIDLLLDSGDTMSATVLSIEDSLAYLQRTEQTDDSSPATTMIGFSNASSAVVGDMLYVLSANTIMFVFDGSLRLGNDSAEVVEGTPVVDRSGALVALCTRDAQGVSILPLPAGGGAGGTPMSTPPTTTASTSPGNTDNTDSKDNTGSTGNTSTTETTSTTTAATTSTGSTSTTTTLAVAAWMGVRLVDSDNATQRDRAAHGVTVASVAPGSPAAAAGILTGQRIVSIDGQIVNTAAAAAVIIQSHRPGDTVQLTMANPSPGDLAGGADSVGTTDVGDSGQGQRRINVVLGEHVPTV